MWSSQKRASWGLFSLHFFAMASVLLLISRPGRSRKNQKELRKVLGTFSYPSDNFQLFHPIYQIISLFFTYKLHFPFNSLCFISREWKRRKKKKRRVLALSWSATHCHGIARERWRKEKEWEDCRQRKLGEKFRKRLEEKDRIGWEKLPF